MATMRGASALSDGTVVGAGLGLGVAAAVGRRRKRSAAESVSRGGREAAARVGASVARAIRTGATEARLAHRQPAKSKPVTTRTKAVDMRAGSLPHFGLESKLSGPTMFVAPG